MKTSIKGSYPFRISEKSWDLVPIFRNFVIFWPHWVRHQTREKILLCVNIKCLNQTHVAWRHFDSHSCHKICSHHRSGSDLFLWISWWVHFTWMEMPLMIWQGLIMNKLDMKTPQIMFRGFFGWNCCGREKKGGLIDGFVSKIMMLR